MEISHLDRCWLMANAQARSVLESPKFWAHSMEYGVSSRRGFVWNAVIAALGLAVGVPDVKLRST